MDGGGILTCLFMTNSIVLAVVSAGGVQDLKKWGLDCPMQKQSFSFVHSLVQFRSGFTIFKQKLSSCAKTINWHVDVYIVGPSWAFWFCVLTLQDLQVEEVPGTFVGVDGF